MYFNQATLPQYPQKSCHSSTTSGSISTMYSSQASLQQFFMPPSTSTISSTTPDENLMPEFLGQPQGVAVGSGQEAAPGSGDVPSNGQTPFEPGMFYDERDPYMSVPNARQSENRANIGPIRNRRTPGMPYTAKNKGRPSTSNYSNSSLDTAALHLQLISDDGEEIRTDHVRRRIMYELSIARISQRQFAEKVLGKTQSTFSGMLNNPKSLRYRGEITYQKIITWINLSCEDRQKVLDGELVICEPDAEPVGKQQQQPKVVPEQVPEPPKEKVKRMPKPRTHFSPEQLSTLQDSFKRNPFPSRGAQFALANQLRLPISTINNWFVNTRKRSKKAE